MMVTKGRGGRELANAEKKKLGELAAPDRHTAEKHNTKSSERGG